MGLSHSDHYSPALIGPGLVPDTQGQPLHPRAPWNDSHSPTLSLLTLPHRVHNKGPCLHFPFSLCFLVLPLWPPCHGGPPPLFFFFFFSLVNFLLKYNTLSHYCTGNRFDWQSNSEDTVAFDPALSLLSFLEGFRTGKSMQSSCSGSQQFSMCIDAWVPPFLPRDLYIVAGDEAMGCGVHLFVFKIF